MLRCFFFFLALTFVAFSLGGVDSVLKTLPRCVASRCSVFLSRASVGALGAPPLGSHMGSKASRALLTAASASGGSGLAGGGGGVGVGLALGLLTLWRCTRHG